MNDGTPLDDEDYSFAPEYWWVRTPDDLANRHELLEQLAAEMPISEAAEAFGLKYDCFLRNMCEKYAGVRYHLDEPKNPELAIPYAEALIDAKNSDSRGQCNEYWGREVRAFCRVRQTPIDYDALLIDYRWLATYPLRGEEYWSAEIQPIKEQDPEHFAYLVSHYTQEDQYRRTNYYLACAWAYYRLGKTSLCKAAFKFGFREPAGESFGFSPVWPVDLLPPIPDPEYLDWQINTQLARCPWDCQTPAVQNWIAMASNEYLRITGETS